jgi:hypothetical protein
LVYAVPPRICAKARGPFWKSAPPNLKANKFEGIIQE